MFTVDAQKKSKPVCINELSMTERLKTKWAQFMNFSQISSFQFNMLHTKPGGLAATWAW